VSRRDFSAWGSFLVVGLWVLIGTMFLNFFFQNAAVGLWLASVSVLLFQRNCWCSTPGASATSTGPMSTSGAAVQIYLDLLNMFMAILRLTGTGGTSGKREAGSGKREAGSGTSEKWEVTRTTLFPFPLPLPPSPFPPSPETFLSPINLLGQVEILLRDPAGGVRAQRADDLL